MKCLPTISVSDKARPFLEAYFERLKLSDNIDQAKKMIEDDLSAKGLKDDQTNKPEFNEYFEKIKRELNKFQDRRKIFFIL